MKYKVIRKLCFLGGYPFDTFLGHKSISTSQNVLRELYGYTVKSGY